MTTSSTPRRILCAGVSITILLSIGTPQVCRAEPSLAQIHRFGAMMIEASEHLDPETIPDIEIVRKQVSQNISDVYSLFVSEYNQTNASRWLGYLDLEPLRTHFESLGDYKSRPSERSVYSAQLKRIKELSSELNTVLGRITANHQGLEREPIVRLRESLQRFRALIRYRDANVAVKAIKSLLARTGKELSDSDSVGPSEIAKLDEISRMLIETAQAPSLSAEMRSHFAQSNLRIGIGSAFVDRFIQRPFSEPSRVNECLFGTRIIGNATLTGHVSSRLLPSQGAASIQLVLTGNLSSQNRGFRFPVTVDALGFGTVRATKVLYLDDAGIRDEPSLVTSNIGSKIQRINHPLKLVQRIALREAEKQSGPSNAEGARRLEKRVAESFDQQALQSIPIGNGDGNLVKTLIAPLERFGLAEPSRHWDSTNSYVLTTMLQRSDDEFAAASPAPAVSDRFDIVLQVHESIVGNAMTKVLGDRTVDGPEILRLIKSIAPKLKFEPRTDETYTFNSDCAEYAKQQAEKDASAESVQEDEPEAERRVELTFTRTRPMIFEARNGRLRVGFRGRRFSDGVREPLNEELTVTCEYQPVEVYGEGYRLQRTGKVAIDFPGQKASFKQIAARKALQCQFELAFPDELLDKPIALPLKQLEGTSFRVRYFRANDGWLTVGLQ